MPAVSQRFWARGCLRLMEPQLLSLRSGSQGQVGRHYMASSREGGEGAGTGVGVTAGGLFRRGGAAEPPYRDVNRGRRAVQSSVHQGPWHPGVVAGAPGARGRHVTQRRGREAGPERAGAVGPLESCEPPSERKGGCGRSLSRATGSD